MFRFEYAPLSEAPQVEVRSSLPVTRAKSRAHAGMARGSASEAGNTDGPCGKMHPLQV